jgi:hypothetical protein
MHLIRESIDEKVAGMRLPQGSNPPPLVSRFLSDVDLLKQCRIDQYRGSGPGGQKRNKTSNAVRIVHLPSGIEATGTEDRSLSVNKLHAIRRLRLKLATEMREVIDLSRFEPPDWFLSIRHENRIEASFRHEYYPAIVGLVLDLLKAMHGNPSDVAVMLGVSTTAIVKLLEAEPQIWTAANRIRAEMSLPALTHRR